MGWKEVIAKAHRLRKMLGAGMRQVGGVAAAGLVSLEKMTGRLKQDHARAKNLYEGLKQVSGLRLEAEPSSNMVYFTLADHIKLTENQIIAEMKKYGVMVDWSAPRQFRLVKHYWVDDAGVEKTVKAFQEVGDRYLAALEDLQKIFGVGFDEPLWAQPVESFGLHGAEVANPTGILALGLHLIHDDLPGPRRHRGIAGRQVGAGDL